MSSRSEVRTVADETVARCPAPEPIPTDEAGLYAFTMKTPGHDRWLIAAWLKQQEGGDWETVADRVCSHVLHDEEVEQARTELREKLAAAVRAVHDARDVYGRLTGDELYDVEYAEGGGLVGHYLDQALLAARTAVAVNPVKE